MFWCMAVLSGLLFGAAHVAVAAGLLREVPVGWPVLALVLVAAYGLAGIHVIQEWNRRPVMRFGRYLRTAGPGLVWIEPAFHTVLPDVLVQDEVVTLKVENVQTHDNVRVSIVVLLTTRVDPGRVRDYTVEVDDAEDATELRAIGAVTQLVATWPLDDLLAKRDQFSTQVRDLVAEKVQAWGYLIKAVEIRDFKIADELIERSISMKARAEKEAQGELRRAELQEQIARHLKTAAAAYDAGAWQLKGLEVLIELGRSAQNNTIMIPSELLTILTKRAP